MAQQPDRNFKTNNMSSKIRYRSAVTGKFVTPAYAKRYPHKVVGERIKKKKCAFPVYSPTFKK